MKSRIEIRLKDVIKYFIEALIVAFGVILGLVLTQQNSQKKTDRNTKIALYQIMDEIDTNILKFEKSLEYHKKMAIEIDSVYQTIKSEDMKKTYLGNTQFRFNKLDGWFGLQTADFEDAIFESAKMNGVFQELNIETIKIISQAYSKMRNYDDFKKSYWDKFLSIDSKTTVMDVLTLMKIMKIDMVSIEIQTLDLLKKTKIELEKTTKNNTYSK